MRGQNYNKTNLPHGLWLAYASSSVSSHGQLSPPQRMTGKYCVTEGLQLFYTVEGRVPDVRSALQVAMLVLE